MKITSNEVIHKRPKDIDIVIVIEKVNNDLLKLVAISTKVSAG